MRVLQTKEVIRIGGKKPIKIDVMIIAATNQDLDVQIAEHFFRKDLYYRLNVFSIHLSPLRERLEDIEIFCKYFIQKYDHAFDKRVSGISEEALRAMRQYTWPGNVGELENTIEHAKLNQIILLALLEDEYTKCRALSSIIFLCFFAGKYPLIL